MKHTTGLASYDVYDFYETTTLFSKYYI